MSILIIGGTGTLGRQVVKQALNEGYDVKCLVRDFRRSAFLQKWGAELVYGDLSIPSTLPLALKDISTIIDTAIVRRTNNYTAELVDWRGKIAIVRIYNRALSAVEIKNHFELERGRFGV